MKDKIFKSRLKQGGNLSIASAIIIVGVLITGAILLRGVGGNAVVARQDSGVDRKQGDNLDKVRPVTVEDHIVGSIDAPVKIIEYSDFECPFCKRFHFTMKQVMDEYGGEGEVAWVYRHFPLDQLHPVKARKEAIASECIAEQGGDDAFWQFTDRFFELTPSNNQTNIDVVLPQIVKEIGLNVDEFNTCLESGKYDKHIDEDIQDAINTGGLGTPWGIVIAEDGTKYPLSGAQPYALVTQIIDLALSSNYGI